MAPRTVVEASTAAEASTSGAAARTARPQALARLVALLSILAASAPAAGQVPMSATGAPGQATAGYLDWYEGLRALSPDPERGARVNGLTITRDVGAFHLIEGDLHLLRDVGGRTIGMAFRGSGRFRMTVPDPVEAERVRREFGASEIDQEIESAVFLFTDLTLDEVLRTGVAFEALAPSNGMKDDVEEAREYFTDGDEYVSPDVLLPLINAGPGFFYAHVAEDRGRPMVFRVDPHQEEEVSLAVRSERNKNRRTVTAFHRASDYQTGRSIPQEALDLIRVTATDIDTEIEGGLDLNGRATVEFERLQTRYDWIPFRLYSELDVEEVVWADGTPADFHRPDESSLIWVHVGRVAEGPGALTFVYEGDMLDRPQGLWIQIRSHQNWFPVYEFGRPVPYRMTFRTSDDFVVAAVGTKTSEHTEDGRTETTWETPPVRQLTFNIGDFDRFESDPPAPGDPSLTVLINESAHKRLADMAAQAGYLMLEQRDMSEMVALDLRAAFNFFNQVYGPTTVRDFVATEIPYSHGEAYPGLVMLAWSTFQWTSSGGFDEMFRAHEVAHQWWGIGVRPATYRDWWLAEGFSEFSGLWYAARAQGSLAMYQERLKETRELLLERRGESDPIALGRRVGTPDHPEDYQQTIYLKGAWVLHMLRTLLTDPDTGSDDRFTQVMQTFYERYRDRQATTAGFQAVVEEVLGVSMDWFFQAWVYGNHIPTYRFSHRYEEQPDGSVIATVRVRQEDVPDDFQMLVPVLLDFGAEGTATVMVTVSGPVSEQQLPILPRVPDGIVFNPAEAVLAETHTEDWRER